MSFDVFGAGFVNYLGEDRQYCTSDYVCEFRRPMGPGFAAGAGFSVGRFRIRTEWTTGPERSLTFTSVPYYRITENDRDSSFAALGGIRTGVPEGFNVVWLAGTAFVTHRNAGTTATSVTFLSQSSSTLSSSALAFAFGTDVSVPVTSRAALVVPVRFTTRPDKLRDPFSKGLDVRVGAGLSLTLFRKPL